mgnify:CR=1 FL=1
MDDVAHWQNWESIWTSSTINYADSSLWGYVSWYAAPQPTPFGLTAREAIWWMRLCWPGMIIGPQHHFLEDLEKIMWRYKQLRHAQPQATQPQSRCQGQSASPWPSRCQRLRLPLPLLRRDGLSLFPTSTSKTMPHPGGMFPVCHYTADTSPKPLPHVKVAAAEYDPADDKWAGRALAKGGDNLEFDDRGEEKLN